MKTQEALQMKYEEVLKLVSDQPIDYNKLLSLDDFLRAQGIEHIFFDVEGYCLARCQERIKKEGPSCLLSVRELQEVLLP